MSYDTHMLLRTRLSAIEIRATLLHDSLLVDLGLQDYRMVDEVGNDNISVIVRPWDEDDRTLIENGFQTATVRVMFVPAKGTPGQEPYRRMFAAVLRLVPGDACAQDQGGGPLGLLRTGDTVYVNPGFIIPRKLIDYGYTPKKLVIGIPPEIAAAAMS